MLKLKSLLISLFCAIAAYAGGTEADSFDNPVMPGFNPDPSICRVGDDYYMVTSSFTWFPGIPIYHSRDLVNWQLIGHAIDRPGIIDMDGLNDNDGTWAATIRQCGNVLLDNHCVEMRRQLLHDGNQSTWPVVCACVVDRRSRH